MTLTAGTAEKPGDLGRLIPKITDYLSADPAARARVHGNPDISNTATTDSNDTGMVIDLTAQGFVFQANHRYKVRLAWDAVTDNDHYYMETVQGVLGGTTPILLGEPRILDGWGREDTTNVAYGNVHYTATVTNGTGALSAVSASPGISVATFATNAADLTLPSKRLSRLKHASLTATSHTEAQGTHISVNPAGGTDAIVSFAGDDGADDVLPATGLIHLAFELWPPGNCFLAMSTNNVQVHVLGITTETIKHRVEVYISDPIPIPFIEGVED